MIKTVITMRLEGNAHTYANINLGYIDSPTKVSAELDGAAYDRVGELAAEQGKTRQDYSLEYAPRRVVIRPRDPDRKCHILEANEIRSL